MERQHKLGVEDGGGIGNMVDGGAHEYKLGTQVYTDYVRQQQVPLPYELGDRRAEEMHERNGRQVEQRHELHTR